MKWAFKYAKSFVLGLQSAMEYRANFLLGVLSTLFPIVIQVFMWTAVFKSSGSNNIYGYNYSQMITYAVLAAIVSRLVSTGVEWDVLNDIKNGGLNRFIVQPVNYLFFRVCCFMGKKTLQTGLIIVIMAIVLTVVQIKLGLFIEFSRAIIFIFAIFLALVLNFMITFLVSFIAFWITEAWGAFVVLNLVMNVASGGVFPLDIFGSKVMSILNVLPFKYIIFFPVNIINGRMDYVEIVSGVAIQGMWIVLLLLLSKVCWGVGLKKYIAVGG